MPLKPICVPCERFMRPKKNGFYFLEGKPWGSNVDWNGKWGKAGEGWTPYKIWVGDLWRCPDCGAEVIVGVNRAPVAEHYQPDFRTAVTRTGALQLLIKDC